MRNSERYAAIRAIKLKHINTTNEVNCNIKKKNKPVGKNGIKPDRLVHSWTEFPQLVLLKDERLRLYCCNGWA